MIFRYLQARCTAQGGALSFEDLEDARERFAASVPSGFDLFETIHLRCMQASGSTAAALFTRDAILITLLFECGYQSAEAAFANQKAYFGGTWLRHFFRGLADYIRESVCKDADYQLIAMYVQAAKKLKGRLSPAELLKETEIQAVLRVCVEPLLVSDASPAVIEHLCRAVNARVAKSRKATEPDPSRVTQEDLQRFLGLMRNEFALALSNAKDLQ